MGRAPTTSRVLLALGALTLAVLTASLLTSTSTASAHDADTPPDPLDYGAEEGPCKGAAETKYGEAAAPTLDDNKKCVEGKSKKKWYHQNYWYPCMGTSTTNCILNRTADEKDYKDEGHRWHEVTLRHFTSSPLDVLPGALTAYLNEVEDTHPTWERSWCGVGNVNGDNAKPFDDWEDAKNANCGHTGNRPHGYFNHQPTEVTVRTRTVYVDTHNHCDDDTHPGDHDNDTCPEDTCPVPDTPAVTVPTPKQFRNSRTQQKVEWEVANQEDPCHIRGYEIQYGNEAARSGTVADDGKSPVTGESWERQPVPGSRIRVYVRVKNQNPADGTDQWSDWGYDDLYGDTVCPLPAAPVVSWSVALERVSWPVPDAGGPSRSIGGYRIVFDPTGGLATDPLVLAASTRWRAVTQPEVGQGPLTVLVGARNDCGWGEYGRVVVPAKREDPPEVCPLPAAPTVTKHGFRTRGGVEEQEVRWEVDDPEGAGCEVTGWFIYYGTDAAREKDKNETNSWERKPVPGSRIRVFVRAENRVRPGSTAKQLSNSGDVDLYGDDVTGARGRTHR